MRTPSIKALTELFGDNAELAKQVLLGKFDTLPQKQLDQIEELKRSCYHNPGSGYVKMCLLNLLGEFQGIEHGNFINGESFMYLNSVDTYNGTLLRYNGNYRITTVGDFVETMERRGKRII